MTTITNNNKNMAKKQEATIEQTNGKFEILVPYEHTNKEHRMATVILEVDHSSGTFDVCSANSTDGKFLFRKASHDHKMWAAVAKAIEIAIDKGVLELKNTKRKN